MSFQMSIFALPGHKVRLVEHFVHRGSEWDQAAAKRHLTVGGIYTVRQTRVFSSHSVVEFEEVPGVSFNTIYFEFLTPQSEEEDQQHPYLRRYYGHPSEEDGMI
ncbi:hypothetical protein [Hymenobacter sp. BT491]|uniref:hypothetical protein n=1 Tax=Hymenobacter sp. BT491 TaxID=2766779 RepID=UPI0016538B63|nr:hypothetical protein [Hymenobacter sp. BT491]MBC6992247.1 hypothetical protein [Hymenobacter sp. BT491]